mmetsp:Transcript_4770/g.13565  ORF Transcript_4770/g.13565 Transcript_4770/m.13565 type:complete len:217 (-) Transcript_4770:460-1110(-)
MPSCTSGRPGNDTAEASAGSVSACQPNIVTGLAGGGKSPHSLWMYSPATTEAANGVLPITELRVKGYGSLRLEGFSIQQPRVVEYCHAWQVSSDKQVWLQYLMASAVDSVVPALENTCVKPTTCARWMEARTRYRPCKRRAAFRCPKLPRCAQQFSPTPCQHSFLAGVVFVAGMSTSWKDGQSTFAAQLSSHVSPSEMLTSDKLMHLPTVRTSSKT